MNIPFSGSKNVQERARLGNIFPRAIRELRQSFARFCLATTFAGAIALVVPFAASAQGNAARAQVTDRVDISRLATLSGNTHPLARASFEQGAAPPNLPMNRIMLVLKRSPEQEAALQNLLEQQQVTTSPSFHKWVTPDQFGQQFGPADADIQAVTSWLSSFGFQSIKVSKGRTMIEFSGTASQVEAALHTQVHRYVVNGESHWANASDPQIPAALAPVVAGVVSLHDFRKKPLYRRSGQMATATAASGARPAVTFTDGSHGLGPADFGVIYNTVGSGMTGAGTTIGVIARTNISNVSDITQFRSIFSLTQNDPQIVLNGPDPGVVSPDEEGEAVLDATWSGAAAPGAAVKLVVSEGTSAADGIFLSEFYIVDNNLADVMTESFIGCEANAPSGEVSALLFLAEQAAAQGITYLVASGDGGPDSCDDQTTIPTQDTPASVNLLASTPFTIAVGGTQFNDTASPSTYWRSTNGPGVESAISYIPENVWNESCASNCPSLGTGLWSSGGGQSAVFTKPSWQSGVAGIPPANSRFVPDVSLTAAGHDGYIVCIDGSCQGTGCPPGVPQCFAGFGGTSASVQAFGGIMALVVQKTGERQGQANYVLYKLAASQAASLASCNGSSSTLPISTCIFNDITSGNTNIPGETGFAAGVGYDQATGLGSVNATNLLNQWHTAIVQGSTTTLSLSTSPATNPITLTHGQPVNVNITVAAQTVSAGTPTGDVSLIAGSTTGQGADSFTLTNGSTPSGSTTTLLPGSPVPGGSYNVTAHYAGDGTFLASDSAPVSVIVNPESSLTFLGIVTPTSNNATSVAYGSPYILAVQVTNSAGALCNPNGLGGPVCPTGTVFLADNGNPLDGVNGNFTLNTLGKFEDQPIQLAAGSHSIIAAYQGDNSFGGSSSTTDTVLVTQAATTTSLAANPTTASAGQIVTLTATVITQSNAIANSSQEPTGNVQFFIGGGPFGAPVGVVGSANSSGLAQAVAIMTTTSLANGQNSITAKYLGDSNYAASAAVSNTVAITVGLAGINLTPTSNTAIINVPALGTPGTQLITVSAAGGFTGSVTLACAVTTAMSGVTAAPTCSFTPSAPITLTATATSGQSTLNINTTVASSIFAPTNRRHGPAPNGLLLSEICAALVSMFLVGLTVKKRRGVVLLTTAVLAVVVIGTSCGSGSSSSGGGHPGTTAGAYSVTVIATPSSGTAQSTTIAVNVP